jgi:hypothetical protein
MLNLEPIKARLAKAPPGPWTVEYDDLVEETYLVDAKGEFGIATIHNPNKTLDPLVNYPTDVSALIEEVERLRAAIQKHKDSTLANYRFQKLRDLELWSTINA